ncbi:efflux RND transporter periplasmic adaptor subunit [Bryobacter aggregatus]|uniref:efflux RND transporter periplasmic adaptor subunit n=1 Tax=Bryobacter aggregatus TaxID=360054 RepID=UPI0012BA88AC|nr:efflux RND transporter periplasmic adaptor subunit [Bryobacter aggregatus]
MNRILILSAVALIASSCGTSQASRAVVDPPKDVDPLAVTAEQMKDMKTERAALFDLPATEEATGKVAFNEDAMTPVFSPYTGRLLQLMAKPGDSVKQGEPLLLIESPDVLDAENDFLAGAANVTKSKALLKQAERTVSRLQRLVQGEAAAPKDLEQAQTDLESAASDVHVAEIQVDSARQRLLSFGKTAAELEQLSVSRRPDRTTRVLSPISGQVVARKAGPGQYVRPDNPDPLFTISDMSSLWLIANVYESQIPLIHVGERVRLKVLAFPNTDFPAQVTYIAPAVNPETRRVEVRCTIRNTNHQLKPEMFASFRFENAARRALLVSQRALVREGNINVVWVLEGGQRVTRRIVEVGAEHDGKIEIKSGLTAGDQVVSDGALFLSSFTRG